jgi:hypothetical protein
MNTTPFWIAMISLLLIACDKEPSDATGAVPKRPSLAERKEAKRQEIAARPRVGNLAEDEALPPLGAPPAATPPAAAAEVPPAAPPSSTPEPSAEEREARRAEDRAERIARMTVQFTARLMERDANGDGLLTKDELDGPMQRGFERMDINGDGVIDATEREAMIKNMADRMSQFNRGGGRGPGRGPGDRGRGGNDRRRDR